MKIIIRAFLILFFSSWLSAITYYVKPDGDNTKDGLSVETAWQTIQKAADTIIANDAVKILSGTYNELVYETTSGVIYEAYDPEDKPIIHGQGIRAQGFRLGAGNSTLRNIKITGTTATGFQHWGGNNVILDGCEFYENIGVPVGIGDATGTGYVLRYCRLEDNTGVYNLWLQGAVTIEYCSFVDFVENVQQSHIYINAIGTGFEINIYNCVLTRGRGFAIRKTNTLGIVNVKNTLIFANQGRALWNDGGGGAITYENCLIMMHPAAFGWTIGTGTLTDLGGNITNQYPGITKYNGQGYIVWRVDDYVTWAEGWAAKAEEYGYYITFYACKDSVESEENYQSRMQALVTAGHEVGSHSKTHPDLTTLTPEQLADEVDRAWLETLLGGGYTVKSFAYPFNTYNATVIDALITAGYESAPTHTAVDTARLRNLKIFEMSGWYFDGFWGDGTEATVRRNARALCAWLAELNAVAVIGNHEAQALWVTRFGWMCDEISKFDLTTIVTARELATLVRDSGLWTDADADGKRWTRTFPDIADYYPVSGSQMIDAGLDVGLVKDFVGRSIRHAPDIGLYENQTNVLFFSQRRKK